MIPPQRDRAGHSRRLRLVPVLAAGLLVFVGHHGVTAQSGGPVYHDAIVASVTGEAKSRPGATSGPAAFGWDTLPMTGATCGRGAPYKYFLNVPDGEPAGLLIYLMGGGACLREGPPPPGVTGIGAQLHCMAYENFTEPTDLYHGVGLLMPFFRRTAVNPFEDWAWAFLPYCTGDLHVGWSEDPYDYDLREDAEFLVTHRGALNLMAVLDDLEGRFTPDTAVVLTGSSAGGFGAIYNYGAVATRWSHVVLLPDAGIGPGHPDSLMQREGPAVAARWAARRSLPDYCATDDCLGDSLHLLKAHARQHTEGDDWRPFGFLQGQRDEVLADYLEIGGCTYQMAFRTGWQADPPGNLRGFIPATTEHTFFPREDYGADGVSLAGWVSSLIEARGPAELPASAVDSWLPCNPIRLPWLMRH